jgi:hypothetical protein
VTDSEVKSEPALIFAADALEYAARSCGDRISAKQRLADLLKDGRISARAERQWLSKKSSLTDAWRSRSKAKFDTDVPITRLTWGRSRFWADDLDMWRWSRNRFVGAVKGTAPGWNRGRGPDRAGACLERDLV